MRTAWLLALIVGFSFSAVAQDFETNANRCLDEKISPDLRIGACTWLLNSGQLEESSIGFAFKNRGYAYSDKGQYDQAINDYSQALRFNPNDADAFKNRGYAYNKKHQYDQAINDYSQAIRLNPNDTIAFNNRGVAYGNKGQHDQAINDYNQVIQLNPNDADAFHNRGYAYSKKRQYDQAINDYNQAIRLNPNDALVFNNKAWLRATALDAANRNGAEALRLAKKAIALGGRDINYLDTLAAAYAESGHFDKAVAEQQTVIRILVEENLTDWIADSQLRLDLYRAKQPYRDK